MGLTLMERTTTKRCQSSCECQKFAPGTGGLFTVLAQAFVKCQWLNTVSAPLFCPWCETSVPRDCGVPAGTASPFWGDAWTGKDMWALGALDSARDRCLKDADSCIILCPCGSKSVWGPWSVQGPAGGGVIYNNKADVGGHRSKGIKMKAVPGGSLMVL